MRNNRLMLVFMIGYFAYNGSLITAPTDKDELDWNNLSQNYNHLLIAMVDRYGIAEGMIRVRQQIYDVERPAEHAVKIYKALEARTIAQPLPTDRRGSLPTYCDQEIMKKWPIMPGQRESNWLQ